MFFLRRSVCSQTPAGTMATSGSVESQAPPGSPPSGCRRARPPGRRGSSLAFPATLRPVFGRAAGRACPAPRATALRRRATPSSSLRSAELDAATRGPSPLGSNRGGLRGSRSPVLPTDPMQGDRQPERGRGVCSGIKHLQAVKAMGSDLILPSLPNRGCKELCRLSPF